MAADKTDPADVIVKIEDTPEFKAALAAALKTKGDELDQKFDALRADLTKSLEGAAAALPANTPADASALSSVFDRLAMAIGEVSDQGTNRKRVAPEELAERNRAFERMGEIIAKLRGAPQSEWPRYKLVAKTNLADRVIDPFRRLKNNEVEQVEILHLGIPNQAMRPVNDKAKAIWKEYIRWLGADEAANGVVRSEPGWLTNRGTFIVGAIPASAAAHGNGRESVDVQGDVLVTTDIANQTVELVSPTDPRAKEMHILGTIADPARAGTVASKVL